MKQLMWIRTCHIRAPWGWFFFTPSPVSDGTSTNQGTAVLEWSEIKTGVRGFPFWPMVLCRQDWGKEWGKVCRVAIKDLKFICTQNISYRWIKHCLLHRVSPLSQISVCTVLWQIYTYLSIIITKWIVVFAILHLLNCYPVMSKICFE